MKARLVRQILPALAGVALALGEVAASTGAEANTEADDVLVALYGVRLRNARVALPALPPLQEGGGWTIECWLTLFDLAAGHVVLDSRDGTKTGMALTSAGEGSLALEINDGRHSSTWQCPPGIVRANQLHHIVVAVDGGARTVRVMIDGVAPANRDDRRTGWRDSNHQPVEPARGALPAATLRVPYTPAGRMKSLRVFRRSLGADEVRRIFLRESQARVQRESPPAPPDIAPIQAPFPMPPLRRPVFATRTFDIREHGAKGDGQTLNTHAIARAIEVCTRAGGGRVLVPKGVWLTGAIHLRSNVDLHLAEGAVLRFSTRPEDYLPAVFTRWAGFECYNYSPLIYARDCTNIAITGRGQLDGQGEAWWHWVLEQPRMAEVLLEAGRIGKPVASRVFAHRDQPLRPQFISPIGCTNVLIEGIALNSGPFWTIQCIYCENVIVRDITIDNYGPNNDGIDLDSSRNALIEYCEFRTGDDSVAIKSGLNEDGWRVGRPSENVVVRHCRMKEGHGVLSIGSEMSGDVRNIYAYDCLARGTERGLRLKSARGRGGVVEGVWMEKMTWEDVRAAAISLTTDYTAWAVTAAGKPPIFRDIHVRDLRCEGTRVATEIVGLDEQPIQRVTLERVDISGELGLTARNVAGLKLLDCELRPRQGPVAVLVNNQDADLQRLVAPRGTPELLRLEGQKTRRIRFSASAPDAARRVVVGPEVARGEVTVD